MNHRNAEYGLSLKLVGDMTLLVGPPPVLSTEDLQVYNQIWQKLIDCLMPRDAMECLLVQRIMVETWQIFRFERHQAFAIERTARLQRNRDIANLKAIDSSDIQSKSKTELLRMRVLQDVVCNSVDEADEALRRPAADHDHNRAFAEIMDLIDRLDKLKNAAIARFDNALKLLQDYRISNGQPWHMPYGVPAAKNRPACAGPATPLIAPPNESAGSDGAN